MNWPKYFCPVSARLGSEDSLSALCANDTPCKPFQPIIGAENRKGAAAAYALAKRYTKAWYTRDGAILDADPALSDACFAAFPLSPAHCLLVAWHAFPAEAVSGIWDELAGAIMDANITGIRKAAVPKNRVVVLLDYLPQWSPVTRETQHGNLIATLKLMHKSGYVHGGINERWLNPESPRRVFGLGLSSAYAAWRATQGIKLRNLRGDPRYACAEELLGEESNPEFDLRALGATLIASYSSLSDDRRDLPWKRNVNGPSALLARIANRESYQQYSKNVRELITARRLLFAKKRQAVPLANAPSVAVEACTEVANIVDRPDPESPESGTQAGGLFPASQLTAGLGPSLPVIFALVIGIFLGGFMTVAAQSFFSSDDGAALAQSGLMDDDLTEAPEKVRPAPVAKAPAPIAKAPAPAPAKASPPPPPPPAKEPKAPVTTPLAPPPDAAYTLRLRDPGPDWAKERAALKEQLQVWLPECQIKAKYEHKNKSPRSLHKAQIRVIQRVEELCVDIDPECADKKGNKIRWQPAAMGADARIRGLVARITFRCESEE